MFFYTVRKHEH